MNPFSGRIKVRSQRLRAFAWIAMAMALVGCGLDANEVTQCRQTLPAINSDDATLHVTSVSAASAPYSVRIAYQANGISRVVLCGFERDPIALARIRLASLKSDEEIYSPLRVHTLNRYWLERPEWAAFADPGPGLAAAPALQTTREVAYFSQQMMNAIAPTSIYILVAAAYALVYGLVGRINLAFGDTAALAGLMAVSGGVIGAATLGGSTGIIAGASILGLAVGSYVGIVGARLVVAPLAFGKGQNLLIATLALGIVMQEGMRLTQGPEVRWLSPVLAIPLPFAQGEDFMATVTTMQLIVGATAMLCTFLLILLMKFSEFGRRWWAVADDPLMARLLGFPAERLLLASLALSALLAALAGVISTLYYGSAASTAGVMIGLKALVAAILGGIGSIPGAMLGGLIIGIFEALWATFLPIGHRDVAVLALLAVILTIRPGGLFGDGTRTAR